MEVAIKMETHTNKPISQLSTRYLVIMAMFTAVLCASSYISIPLPNGSHITAFNFIVTIIVLTFPVKQALTIILAWLLLGVTGVPVLVGGNAGIGYILGPYGGYSIAFVLIAIFIPLLCSKKYNLLYFSAVAILSAVIVNLTGTLWIMAVSKVSFKAAFVIGFIPFIALDAIKAIIAAQLVPKMHNIINSTSR